MKVTICHLVMMTIQESRSDFVVTKLKINIARIIENCNLKVLKRLTIIKPYSEQMIKILVSKDKSENYKISFFSWQTCSDEQRS